MSFPLSPASQAATTRTLTEGETDVVYAALAEAVRVTDGRYEVRADGRWRADDGTAAAMAAEGLLRTSGESVTVTDDGREAAGFLSVRKALALEVGEQFAGLIVSDRRWDGPMVGSPATVLLTGDGRGYDTSGWCNCPRRDLRQADSEVQVERWSRSGREFHGWLHRVCRRLTQTG